VRNGEDEEKRTIFGKSGLGRSTSSSGVGPQVSTIVTPLAAEAEAEDEEEVGATPGEDDTVRLAPIPSATEAPDADATAATPEGPGHPEVPTSTSDTTPVSASPVEAVSNSPKDLMPRKAEGVEIELETVKSAVVRFLGLPRFRIVMRSVQAKIWSTMGEFMRQGVPDSKAIGQGIEETMCAKSSPFDFELK